MHILVSNDDGVHALGIKALTEALSEFAAITTVAPDRNCSGASHSLTLDMPLRVQQLDNGYYSVSGTPSDCVHFALNELLEDKPTMVVSGINAGANLGDDVIYSGTVAAATEGRQLGSPAIAVSLVGKTHYASAAKVLCLLVQRLADAPLEANQILNVNVPDLPYEELKGIKVTRLGNRHIDEKMIKQSDPRGHEVYWVGPPGKKQDAGEGTDFYAVEHGFVSITPLTVDLTAFDKLSSLSHWTQELSLQ